MFASRASQPWLYWQSSCPEADGITWRNWSLWFNINIMTRRINSPQNEHPVIINSPQSWWKVSQSTKHFWSKWGLVLKWLHRNNPSLQKHKELILIWRDVLWSSRNVCLTTNLTHHHRGWTGNDYIFILWSAFPLNCLRVNSFYCLEN